MPEQMIRRTRPSRGEIWIVDLNANLGQDARGLRRALVVSANELNHGAAGCALVMPISAADRRIATHVRVPTGEAGQTADGFVKCEEVRSVSIERFTSRMGVVKAPTLAAVMRHVAVLLVV